MKTFLKISLLGLVALVVFHFRNLILAPIAVAVGICFVGGGILTVGLLAILGVGAGVVFSVVGAALALALVLSPIILPALAVWGVYRLLRRRSEKAAAAAI